MDLGGAQYNDATFMPLDRQTSGALNSPIAVLNEDLLRLIFQFNTESAAPLYNSESFMEKPLTSSRLSTQVCRSWRHLLLNSPTIWGKLMDIDSLDQRRDEWREELLRRTQSSPLHVKGNITGSDDAPTPVRLFFHRLLRQCWERIERLEIVVFGSHTSDRAWNAFLSPAPKLQTFEIYFPDVDDSVNFIKTSSQGDILFGNHVPSLLEFQANAVEFPTNASWLSNLRMIDMPLRLTVPEILYLLNHTPLLKYVFIYGGVSTEEWIPYGKFQHVELPRLTFVYLSDSLASCSTILEHIHPAKACSLSLTTVFYDKRFITTDVLRSFQQSLPRYVQNYFSTYISTRVKLRFFEDTFDFEDESKRDRSDVNFCIKICTGPSEALDGAELTNILLQVFNQCNLLSASLFSHVTTLSLDMRYAEASSLPYFYSLFSSFPSVLNLKTNEDSIVFLHSVQSQAGKNGNTNDQTPLFPTLNILQLTYLDPDYYMEPDTIPGCLLPFLKGRNESGHPISTLDLRLCGFDTLRDIDFLEEVDGLKVLSDEGGLEASYTCGSGRPENLRFRTKGRSSSRIDSVLRD